MHAGGTVHSPLGVGQTCPLPSVEALCGSSECGVAPWLRCIPSMFSSVPCRLRSGGVSGVDVATAAVPAQRRLVRRSARGSSDPSENIGRKGSEGWKEMAGHMHMVT